MKLYHFLFILIVLQSCDYQGQEKITKLSREDQKSISKMLDDKSFELKKIIKTDSSKNSNIISYYCNDFLLSSKEIYLYNENRKLDIVRVYDSNVKGLLPLFSEKKYTYSDGYEKMVVNVWRKGKEDGRDEVEKTFDERGKLIQKISKSSDDDRSIIVKENFKYVWNDLQKTETVCVEEYNKAMTPKSFESCTTYLIENGKITNKIFGNEYVYDNKKD